MNICEPPLEPCDDSDQMKDWIHVDEVKKYDDAKDYLEEVIHQVYNIGNVDALEDALDELANVFEIRLPNQTPKLVKRSDELYDKIVQLSHPLNNLSKIGETR